MRISDWSSDVCSSDLRAVTGPLAPCAPGLFASSCALLLRHVADHSCPASQDHALFIIDFACGDRIDTQQVCNLARLDNALTRKQRGKHRECSPHCPHQRRILRSEEHTSELQSLMRISYAVFCLKKKKEKKDTQT